MPQVFDRYRLDGADLRRVGGPASHLVRDLIESLPVDPDALHVAESSVIRVSLGSLVNRDPFQPMSPRERSYTVADNARVHYAECGYFARLSAVQARLTDHARDGRAR